jgi:hypothetical protein
MGAIVMVKVWGLMVLGENAKADEVAGTVFAINTT